MVAIEVKYLGPTNNKGSRYKAYTGNGQALTVNANYALNPEENAEMAAIKLRNKMKWNGNLVGGSTKSGWVFVFTN